MYADCESLHDVIICRNTVSVASRLEGVIQNGVSITMKSYHGVLIATPCSDGEEAAVIGVHISYGILIDVDLSIRDAGEEGYGGFSCRYFGAGGLFSLGFSVADSLAGLDHVDFYVIYLFQEVFICVRKCGSRSHGVVASLDCGQPRGLDG